MVQAMWCDLGQHAFPYGQKGSTTIKISEQVRNQWGGTQPSDNVKDVCAACAKDYGYRGLTTDVSDDELEAQAETIRERSGGITRKALPEPDPVREAEEENDKLRLSQMERELIELRERVNAEAGRGNPAP